MTRLSLCMIVRDEAEHLDACLDSVEGVVDEIVIADTGSRDGTWQKVRARAQRSLQIPWRDHFADARNAALAQASGDWVLMLDADERLAEGASRLRGALDRRRLLAGRIRVRSDVGEGRHEDFHALRLFRRLPELRWSGRIHEQVSPALRDAVKADPSWKVEVLSGVRIDHEGYRPDLPRASAKQERNLRLLRLAVAEQPEQAYLHYKLAQALRSADAEGEAERWAGRHLEQAAELLLGAPREELREQAMAAEVLTAAAQHWLWRDRPARAAEACRVALGHAGDHPATRYVYGQALLAQGSGREAVVELERALADPIPETGFYYPREEQDAAARALLAHAHLLAGAPEHAAYVLQDARRDHPEDPRLAHGWLSLLVRTGRSREALREGLAWLASHPEDGRSLLICADAAEALGHLQQAQRWRQRVPAGARRTGAAEDDRSR